MRRGFWIGLLAAAPLAAQVAPIPTPTQLPGSPFAIKKSWIIGGPGNWDYLTIDSDAQRLYIAHEHSVQVVDLDSGSMAGEISGFGEAHAIALDDTGEYGYVSDGRSNTVAVFERSSLKVESNIPIACSPRSIAFEPSSKLVIAVCGPGREVPNVTRPPGQRAASGTTQGKVAGMSHIVAIDTEQKSAIAAIAISGDARFAQADGAGAVYVTVGEAEGLEIRNGSTRSFVSPPRIVKVDGPTLASAAERDRPGGTGRAEAMDWSEDEARREGASLTAFSLPAGCAQPQGLAVDGRGSRLFAACNGQQLLVLNATNGHVVTALTTGPGDDAVGYDPERELIYSANGEGYGSLTIVQQDANTDSYAVIESLPTLAHARTLAVDPSTGLVYLVTDTTGVDLGPRGAFVPIKPSPIAGSFRVLVVGH